MSASAPTFTKSGAKSTTAVKLDSAIFGLKPNSQVLKDAYTAYLANGRENLATSKSRGLVRGGGKKPWRQKGTGRARFGSSRNPIWRGGGVAFGPTGNENYSHKITTGTKRQALKHALSSVSSENRVKIIDTFECKEPKTKTTAGLLKKLGAGEGSTLLVVSRKYDLVIRATSNIPNLKVKQAKYINTFDVLNADTIIISKKSLEIITEWLSPKAIAKAKPGSKK